MIFKLSSWPDLIRHTLLNNFSEKATYGNWVDMILEVTLGVQVVQEVLEDLDDHRNQFLVRPVVPMVQVAQLWILP